VKWTPEEASAFIAENRPKFDGTLARLKNGAIDGIVAWQPNRLSRNALEAGKIAHYINIGIIKDIKFVTYTFENTPEGVKNLQYALADSQFYSADLSRNIKRGNKEKRKRGWLSTANLAGYMNSPNTDYPNDPTENITVIDPVRFNMIRRAWDLLLAGDYSVPAILDILNNQWGYRTRKTRKRGNTPMSKSSLYYIFNNIRYAGKMLNPANGELLDGTYPAMITIDEYDKAQFILGKHGKPRITEKRDFALKGIAVCGECGCSITAERQIRAKFNRSYVYYHCTHKKKEYRCRQPSVEEGDFIRQIDDFFARHSIRKEFVECGLEAIQEMNDMETGDRQEIIDNQTKALKDAEVKANRLLDLITNGIITENQYKQKSVEINETVNRLRKEQERTLKNGNDWREAMRKTLDVLFNGREQFGNGDIFVKREILSSLGSNITIKDRKFHINTYKWLEPIQNKYKAFETQFDKVRTSDLQGKKVLFESIRPMWWNILHEVRTIMMESDLQPLLHRLNYNMITRNESSRGKPNLFVDYKKKTIQKQKRLSDTEIASIIVEYKNGINTNKLAQKYGCHPVTIGNHLKKHGIIVNCQKIKMPEEAEILRLYESGLTIKEISGQFKVNESTINLYLHKNKIKMRTRWDYPQVG
jgi:DNA invertase Pin-like site-specific DNA recombinase